ITPPSRAQSRPKLGSTPPHPCRCFRAPILTGEIGGMAKLTRTSSVSALAEGQPVFSVGSGRFTIGITGREGTTYHVHLPAGDARRFVAYIEERVELTPFQSIRYYSSPRNCLDVSSGWEEAAS